MSSNTFPIDSATSTHRECSLAFKDILDALEEKFEVESSGKCSSSTFDAPEKEMNQVKRLDDCNLIIRVGLLKQDHYERIQQFFIRQ